MNFEEQLLSELQKRYPNADIRITDVPKTNVTLRGLSIRGAGESVTPQIYIGSMQERFEEGVSMDVIVSEIDNIYQENKGIDIVPEMNRENFLDHTRLKLINKAMNPDKVENTPFIDMDEFIAIPVYVENSPEGAKTIVMNYQLLSHLDIKPEEALAAGKKALDPTLLRMDELLMAMIGDTDPEVAAEIQDVIDASNPDMLYVISNPEKMYGAASLLADGKLQEIAERLDDDFYIIPSSIHECLIIAATGHDPELLNYMVKEVNAECVRPEEILGENVCIYSRELGQIKSCKVAELGDNYGV